ncbi:MAG: hypothetical protein P1V97_00495, partial [Planctomycetota bacterium]|nr:hypothetical protein [Planctomycetota bacterium]
TAPGAGSMMKDVLLEKPNEQKSLVYVLNPLWTVKGRFLDPDGSVSADKIRLTVYPEAKKIGNSTRMSICFDRNLNAEGQFQFSGTNLGRYRLLFHHWGKGVALTSTHFVTIKEARVYDLNELLAPAVKIYGRVLDQQSNPIENVSIWGGGTTEKDVYTLPHYECTTDEDGRVALRFSKWHRLSVHIDQGSLPKKLRLDETASPKVQHLSQDQSQFRFILKRKPTPVHFIVPESLPTLFCHVYSLKNNEGYLGSGGSRKDEQRGSLVFPFSSIDPGDYNIYFQGPGAPWKQTDWYGGTVTIPDDQNDAPIEIHFDRQNKLQTTAHQFDFTGKVGSTLSIWSPSKNQHRNLLTLTSKKNMVIYKPKGLKFTMQAPGHLMNGQLNYDFPETGGRVKLKIHEHDKR